MLDDNKIPQKTYIELCELMGKEEAEEYIKRHNYYFHEVQKKILLLTLKNSIKNHPILFIIIGTTIIGFIIYRFGKIKLWW
jgi:hypothetical protein